MNINIERLKNDAAYWAECGAPEDATHYVNDTFTKWVNGVEFDYLEDAEEWLRTGTQYALERYMEDPDEWVVIPRPTTQSQEWDGEGLPPSGVTCECLHLDSNNGKSWVECDVIGPYGDYVVCAPNGGGFFGFDAHELRPIRTPEQRQRDELITAIPHPGFHTKEDIADAILAKYNLTEK